MQINKIVLVWLAPFLAVCMAIIKTAPGDPEYPASYDEDIIDASCDCINGYCDANGTCLCDPGFKRLANSCEPLCTKECVCKILVLKY